MQCKCGSTMYPCITYGLFDSLIGKMIPKKMWACYKCHNHKPRKQKIPEVDNRTL